MAECEPNPVEVLINTALTVLKANGIVVTDVTGPIKRPAHHRGEIDTIVIKFDGNLLTATRALNICRDAKLPVNELIQIYSFVNCNVSEPVWALVFTIFVPDTGPKIHLHKAVAAMITAKRANYNNENVLTNSYIDQALLALGIDPDNLGPFHLHPVQTKPTNIAHIECKYDLTDVSSVETLFAETMSLITEHGVPSQLNGSIQYLYYSCQEYTSSHGPYSVIYGLGLLVVLHPYYPLSFGMGGRIEFREGTCDTLLRVYQKLTAILATDPPPIGWRQPGGTNPKGDNNV